MTTQSRFAGRDALMSIVSAMLGTAIWIALPIITDRKEAWDAPLYWPVVALTSFVLGLIAPVRAWRWGLALAAGQFGALLAESLDGAGNLLPLGLILLVALGAVCAILSWLGGKLRTATSRDQSSPMNSP
jgi:hypothetical protein